MARRDYYSLQTVQIQVKKQEIRKRGRGAEDEEEEEFSTAAHEERALRKRLAKVEGAIAGL